MYNILISGVGGQGTLLASRILGQLFISAGRDVKVSEVHGMSQRGGSVVTYVRAAGSGESVSSPLIPEGQADVLIAFEELEALRWISMVKKGGAVAVNTARILPMPVLSGAAAYPEDVLERLNKTGVKLMALDAQKLSEQAGGVRCVNVVMLGAVSAHMGFSNEEWIKALEKTVVPRFLEMNLLAFSLGREAMNIQSGGV